MALEILEGGNFELNLKMFHGAEDRNSIRVRLDTVAKIFWTLDRGKNILSKVLPLYANLGL